MEENENKIIIECDLVKGTTSVKGDIKTKRKEIIAGLLTIIESCIEALAKSIDDANEIQKEFVTQLVKRSIANDLRNYGLE